MLLIQAVFWLVVEAISLRFFPTRTLRNSLRRDSDAQDGVSTIVEPVTWAITVAARYVPANTCLTRALAASRLLARRGVGSRLQIGVARIDGEFQAHAWVECNGDVIVGKTKDLGRFVPLRDNKLAIARCVA
jgi:hypothetical protein